jgi:hypothetical protein
MSNIEELLGHAKKLVSLLEEPEPGLFTWHEFVHEKIKAIAEFDGYVLPSASGAGDENK